MERYGNAIKGLSVRENRETHADILTKLMVGHRVAILGFQNKRAN